MREREREGVRGIMVISVGNGHKNLSSNPRLVANTLGNGMNLIILPIVMTK